MTHHWWGEYSVWPPTATPPLVNLHLAHYYTHTCSSRANEGERQRKRQRKDKDKCQMKIHNFLSLSFFCCQQQKYTTPYPSSDLSTLSEQPPLIVYSTCSLACKAPGLPVQSFACVVLSPSSLSSSSMRIPHHCHHLGTSSVFHTRLHMHKLLVCLCATSSRAIGHHHIKHNYFP